MLGTKARSRRSGLLSPTPNAPDRSMFSAVDISTYAAGSPHPQGCSVLCGNAPIRLVGADIASQGLKSPSYQGLTLVSPGVRVHGKPQREAS